LSKGRSSADLSRQLEEEQQSLAKLQAEQEEQERAERERRQMERQRRELELEKERAERDRRELEEQRRRSREEAERMTSAKEQERRRQKELLLAKMKAIDDGTVKHSDDASQPMNGLIASKRAVAADDDVNDAVFGGYRPSFLAGSTTSASKTKAAASKRRVDQASRPPRNSLLIFDDDLDNPESPDLDFLSNPSSQGEVGAGDRHANKHLLPRRTQQQTTTVNGGLANDVSDDIEELIL